MKGYNQGLAIFIVVLWSFLISVLWVKITTDHNNIELDNQKTQLTSILQQYDRCQKALYFLNSNQDFYPKSVEFCETIFSKYNDLTDKIHQNEKLKSLASKTENQ